MYTQVYSSTHPHTPSKTPPTPKTHSGAEYWHEYTNRGVNTINPWVPFTMTLLVPCAKDKPSTIEAIKSLVLPWEALPGQNIQRAVPLCVFAPHGWEDMLPEFGHPMKYYRAVFTPSAQHPVKEHLLTGNIEACSSHLPLAYVLQVRGGEKLLGGGGGSVCVCVCVCVCVWLESKVGVVERVVCMFPL